MADAAVIEANGTTEPSKRAVIYLRVSTSAQADKDYGTEGYSIPAQREACKRAAEGLGAQVVEEYLDRGESARSADRPALLAMLERIKDRDIDYVIVHKVDRLARNRADDIEIALAVRASGARLVSASENIDQTPSGTLLHGIMATIAEFYSQNLAAEVRKGLLQKVRLGGTPTKAPIGYLNVIERHEGRDIRTVIVDAERSPHVIWLFERYVTGEYLIRELTEALADRGLRTRPTTKRPEGTPVTVSMVERMLANPYYAGVVVFEGVRYQGRHQPLISMELFEEVTALKASRRLSKEKPYQHPHYLKGTVACGQCGDRLGVTKVTNRHGQKYDYFYCLGRQKHRSDCTQTYVAMDLVEDRVADLWRSVVLPADVRAALRRAVLDLAERTQTEQSAEIGRCTARLARLDAEREKLLQAHYAEAVPLDLLKREQARIAKEMAATQAALGRLNTELGAVEEGLDQALALVADCHQLYLAAPAHIRRQLNQAVFEQILVDDGEVPTGRLAAPFGQLLELVEQAEVKDWRSEDQLKRYLRRDPREPTSVREIEATIARVLGRDEERAVLMDGPRKNKNPGPHVLGQGLNVALLAEREGFEPSRREIPSTRFPVALLRPLGHLSRRAIVAHGPRRPRRRRGSAGAW
jgi:site-specific DNA recombinase